MISQIVVDYQNVRYGIEILRKSGLVSEKKGMEFISADVIREASYDVFPIFNPENIDSLKKHELLALYGLTLSLLDQKIYFVLVDDAFEYYKKACVIYSVDPQVRRIFRNHIYQLSHLKIIAYKSVRIENASQGRRLEVTLLDFPATEMLKLVKDILKKFDINHID